MPIFTPGGKVRQSGVADVNGAPIGERSRRHHDPPHGIPRNEDFAAIRMLERTHPISLPMGTIKTQVSTTPFAIRPTVDEPGTEHEEAAEEIEEGFLRGRYNSNGDPWDHLIKNWAHDIISIDTGVIEKVPNESGFLGELYNRDGASFTKNLDKHGRLPEPNQGEDPAYWQYAFGSAIEPWDPSRNMREMAEEFSGSQYGIHTGEPIGFSRDQLVWTSTNPAPWRNYGYGKVSQARRVAEIVLNQDSSNLSYFAKNEVPDGVVNIVEANQDEVNRFREYWKENVKGREHVLPIVGGGGSDIDWIPFRPTPDELEFMASQKWYNQLIWMIFGLNQGEVGDIENINRATMEKQAENVFRTTTKPLLDRLENEINRHILPFMEAYQRVSGELEFAFQFDNPAIEQRVRERQSEDLESGTKTINEIRIERGDEPLPWGNMPLELMRSTARSHPDWALEQWADVDDPPTPAPSGLLSAYSGSGSGSSSGSNSDGKGAGIDFPSPGSDNELPSGDRYRALMSEQKEPLRNEEWDWQFPPLAGVAESLASDVGSLIAATEEDVVSIIEEEFPEDEPPAGFGHRPTVDSNLGDVASGLANDLQSTVIERNIEAMDVSAEYHAEELIEEAEKSIARKDDSDGEVAIDIDFDVQDTPAADRMRREAAARMNTVSQTVIESIRNLLLNVAEDGGNVTEATAQLREHIDELSDSHARLVGRTEILTSQRFGSQSLAESVDLVGGKQWDATSDGRTRSWHAAMDGEIVPKDETFLVPKIPEGQLNDGENQPPDYPRRTFVVGDDQPFNCRCAQGLVLAEDMPDDLTQLNSMAGVAAYRIPSDSPRMREVIREFGEPGESLGDLLARSVSETGSVNKACKRLGISTATHYQWAEIVSRSPE